MARMNRPRFRWTAVLLKEVSPGGILVFMNNVSEILS
jgi:hypothetical protein